MIDALLDGLKKYVFFTHIIIFLKQRYHVERECLVSSGDQDHDFPGVHDGSNANGQGLLWHLENTFLANAYSRKLASLYYPLGVAPLESLLLHTCERSPPKKRALAWIVSWKVISFYFCLSTAKKLIIPDSGS